MGGRDTGDERDTCFADVDTLSELPSAPSFALSCSTATRQSGQALPLLSDVDLHGDFDSVVDLDAEIPHRAFYLGMSEQELHRTLAQT